MKPAPVDAGDAVADPGGTDTSGEVDRLVRDVAGGVAVDEQDPVGDAEFGGAGLGLPGEDRADVHPGAGETQVACPGAQHLARAAGQVEHPCPGGEME